MNYQEGRSRIKSILLFLLFFMITFFIALGLLKIEGDTPQGGMGFFEANKHLFLVVRVVIFALIIGFWPKIVNFFAIRKEWPEDYTLYVQKARWRLLTMIVLIELVIIQNGFGKLIEFFSR